MCGWSIRESIRDAFCISLEMGSELKRLCIYSWHWFITSTRHFIFSSVFYFYMLPAYLFLFIVMLAVVFLSFPNYVFEISLWGINFALNEFSKSYSLFNEKLSWTRINASTILLLATNDLPYVFHQQSPVYLSRYNTFRSKLHTIAYRHTSLT